MSTEKAAFATELKTVQQLENTLQTESQQKEISNTDITEQIQKPRSTSNEPHTESIEKNIFENVNLKEITKTKSDGELTEKTQNTEVLNDQKILEQEKPKEISEDPLNDVKASTEPALGEIIKPISGNSDDFIFDLNKNVSYSSDELDEDSDDSDSDTNSSSDDSNNLDTSSDDSDSDDESIAATNRIDEVDEFNESDGDEGPIRSKNEIVDEKADSLPEGFTIGPDDPIEYVGTITGLVERSVVIKGVTSAEYKVLKEGAILCFEDRTPLGPLFEIFGQLHSPIYRVKFNNVEEFERFSNKKGERVFYVVPNSEFVLTSSIKSIKGTDASAWNDEELAPEQQEFSDDEKESAAKSAKKKKRKSKNTNASGDKKQKRESQQNQNQNQNQGQRKQLPNYMKARLTSLPISKPVFNKPPQQQYKPIQHPPLLVSSQKFSNAPPNPLQFPVDAGVFQQMQQLLQLASQAQNQNQNQQTQHQYQQNQIPNGQPQHQYYQQPYYPQQQQQQQHQQPYYHPQQPYYVQQQQQQNQHQQPQTQYSNTYPTDQQYQQYNNYNQQQFPGNYPPQNNYSTNHTVGQQDQTSQEFPLNSAHPPIKRDEDEDGYDPSNI